MPNTLNNIAPFLLFRDALKITPTVVTVEDPYRTQKGDYPNGKFPNANPEYKQKAVDNREQFLISADKKDIIRVPGTYGVVKTSDDEYHADLEDVVAASLNPNMSLNRVKRLAKLDAMNGAVGPRLDIDDPNVVNAPNNWDYEYSMFRKAYEDGVKARFIKKFIKWNEKDPVGAANAFEKMQRDGKIPSHWRLPAGSRQEKVYNNLREYYTGPQYRLYNKPFTDAMLTFANAVPQAAGLLMGASGAVGKGWARPVGASSTAPAFNPSIVNNVARFGQASIPFSRQAAQVIAGTLGALAANEAVKGLSNGKYNSTGELVTNPDDPWYVKLAADIVTNPFSYPSSVYKNIANMALKGGKTAAKYVGSFLNNLSGKVQPIYYPEWKPSNSGVLPIGLSVPSGLRNWISKPKNRIVPTGYRENPGEFARTVFNDESLPLNNWFEYKVFENGDEVGTRLMKEDITGKYIIDNLNNPRVARIQYAGSKGSWDNPKYVVKYIDESGMPQITLIDDFDDAALAAGKFYNKDPRSGGAILGTYDDKAMKWNPLPEEDASQLTPKNKAEGTNTSGGSNSNSDESAKGFWSGFMEILNKPSKKWNTEKFDNFMYKFGSGAGKFVRKFPKWYIWGYEAPSAILNAFGISPAQLRFEDTYDKSSDAGRDKLSREGVSPLSWTGRFIEWLFPYANRYKDEVEGSKQGSVQVNDQSSSSSETGEDGTYHLKEGQ